MALVNKSARLFFCHRNANIDRFQLAALCVGNLHRAASSLSTTRWDLVSSVCLERMPVITRDLNPIEHKFQTLQTSIEFERSLKSDHEQRKEQDRIQAELLKKGDIGDADQGSKTTAQDFEDASQDEFAKFHLAPRIFVDDTTVSSVQRKLDKHLMLLVQQNIGAKSCWMLPQQIRKDGETLRQTAERALQETCGSEVKATFLGNAPWGFYKYKYPKEVRESKGSDGAKIFFFKALYNSGEVKGNEFQWLTKQEAGTTLPEQYFKSVDQFLIQE